MIVLLAVISGTEQNSSGGDRISRRKIVSLNLAALFDKDGTYDGTT
jgi:hypothetical protein